MTGIINVPLVEGFKTGASDAQLNIIAKWQDNSLHVVGRASDPACEMFRRVIDLEKCSRLGAQCVATHIVRADTLQGHSSQGRGTRT